MEVCSKINLCRLAENKGRLLSWGGLETQQLLLLAWVSFSLPCCSSGKS
jgi:hypothetical protein